MEFLNDLTRQFIQDHLHDDVRSLALRHAPQGVDHRLALQQIEGWQLASKKIPSWTEKDGLLYPPRISMEQCSSEQTALYKQKLIKRLISDRGTHSNSTFVDLTGGFGIDFSFIAPLFERAVYIERNETLCQIAKHNFKILGLTHADILNIDSSTSVDILPEATCFFIDPARRDKQGKKTIAIEDCEPNLTELQDTLSKKATYCVIKLSPMLDISMALKSLNNTSEVHVVSVQNECKELLLVMSRYEVEEPIFHCVNIGKSLSGFTFLQKNEAASEYRFADGIGKYLYEPDASVMKCGGFRSLCTQYAIDKLHPHSHLYTSDSLITDFPGRTFVVMSQCGFNKQELKSMFNDLKQANLTIRNFPATVADLRKRLKLKDGGEDYIFATTTVNDTHILIRCKKV